MRHYPLGQTIHLFASFVADGEPVDPEDLHVEVELNGDQASLDPERLVKGSFALDYLPEASGDLVYRWRGLGTATPDIHVQVLETRFSAP